jgi:hypothetical protein
MSPPGATSGEPTDPASGPLPPPAAKEGSPPEDRRSRRFRRSVWVAAGAIAVAGLSFVALVATGVITLGGPGGSGAVPYSEARAASAATLAQNVGGNWTVVAATGVDDRSPTTVSLANASTFLGPNCTPVAPPGPPGPTELNVPSYSGPWSSGLSPFWILVLETTSTPRYGIAAVVDGSTEDSAPLNGTGCASALGTLTPLPPATVDSPTAAKVAWNSEGSMVVGVDPNLSSETMIAIGSYTHSGVTLTREWIVEYAACGPFVTGSVSDAAFVAVLNLTTAAFSTAISTSTHCPA